MLYVYNAINLVNNVMDIQFLVVQAVIKQVNIQIIIRIMEPVL